MTNIGRALGLDQQFEKMCAQMMPQMLMQRVGMPEDIANLASFLASDDARNITGSIFVSDSGCLVKPIQYNHEEVVEKLKAEMKNK